MTRIGARVLSTERKGDLYCVTVRIERSNFRGSFNSLRFGEKIPFSGSYRDRTLELRYYQDPGFTTGQQFPLWSIEFRKVENRRPGR